MPALEQPEVLRRRYRSVAQTAHLRIIRPRPDIGWQSHRSAWPSRNCFSYSLPLPDACAGSKTVAAPQSMVEVLIKCVSRATKNVSYFVPDQFLDLRARRSEILARVEFFGVFDEGLADSGRHRQP